MEKEEDKKESRPLRAIDVYRRILINERGLSPEYVDRLFRLADARKQFFLNNIKYHA